MTSRQQYFDQAITTLSEMNGQCVSVDGTCKYGDGQGRHCAVGMFLSEGPWMEYFGGVKALLQKFPELKKELSIKRTTIQFWTALQKLHDPTNHWRDGRFVGWLPAYEFAQTFKLNTKTLDKLAPQK